MRRGYLSEYFEKIAAKTLSAVEADAGRSNQHEFNGVATLKQILAISPKRSISQRVSCTLMTARTSPSSRTRS